MMYEVRHVVNNSKELLNLFERQLFIWKLTKLYCNVGLSDTLKYACQGNDHFLFQEHDTILLYDIMKYF